MNARTDVYWLVGICVLLAILLLAQAISAIVAGLLFAVAVLGFGLASGGFRK